MAETPGWSSGLWQGDREPEQPWAKQGSCFPGQAQALSSPPAQRPGWAGGSALSCGSPGEAKQGSCDNKVTHLELKQNTPDGQEPDSQAAAPPACLQGAVLRSLLCSFHVPLCHLGHQRAPLSQALEGLWRTGELEESCMSGTGTAVTGKVTTRPGGDSWGHPKETPHTQGFNKPSRPSV
uniref:Uncharacterized protein n=1 Tax=Molossus molossus TaxID=27622 RepID=A0A7J8FRN8_MOLMO|nr:hypothetical protein HJG59_008327 [Molossus molossus]